MCRRLKAKKGKVIMVEINQERCVGCGACARDCFGKAIRMADNKASIIRECMQCGHCVALCPVKAVSIPEYDMEGVEEYNPQTFHVEPENLLHAVKFRRSIRNYRQDKIERDKAGRVLEAGRYTATARNMQDCTFIFVQNTLEEFRELLWGQMPEVVAQLHKNAPAYARIFGRFYENWKKNPCDDSLFFHAPAFLAIASDNPLDGGLAAANIENMAVAEGLGVLYSGYLMRIVNSSTQLKEWLGMEDKTASCCMLLGYPAVSYRRTAPRGKGHIVWK